MTAAAPAAPGMPVVAPRASRARSALIGLIVAGFLVVQVAVPMMGLFANRPAPFAWQMYSVLGETPQVWTVNDEGLLTEVDMSAVFARHRAELDYASIVMALCRRQEAVVAIRIQTTGGDPEELTCER